MVIVHITNVSPFLQYLYKAEELAAPSAPSVLQILNSELEQQGCKFKESSPFLFNLFFFSLESPQLHQTCSCSWLLSQHYQNGLGGHHDGEISHLSYCIDITPQGIMAAWRADKPRCKKIRSFSDAFSIIMLHSYKFLCLQTSHLSNDSPQRRNTACCHKPCTWCIIVSLRCSHQRHFNVT